MTSQRNSIVKFVATIALLCAFNFGLLLAVGMLSVWVEIALIPLWCLPSGAFVGYRAAERWGLL